MVHVGLVFQEIDNRNGFSFYDLAYSPASPYFVFAGFHVPDRASHFLPFTVQSIVLFT